MTAPRARLLLIAPMTVLLAAAACGRGAQQGPARPAVPVRAGVARSADVPVTITAIGTVEPFSSVPVKTMVGGELLRAHFVEGQIVRRGDVLFTIDPRPYEAALLRAEANLARDEAELQKARADERRYAELVEKDYVTREQYDGAQTAVAALEATVRADKAALDDARVNLEYCTIRSPIDGRMGKLFVHPGTVLKANDLALVTINQFRPVKVAFAVPESRLPEVRRRFAEEKLRVEATPPGEGAEPVQGMLDFIDNSVDRDAGTILLKGLFPNADSALWPGQFVNVRLTLETRTGVTLAPTKAVQTGQQGAFVFVIKTDQTVEQRAVDAGATIDDETIIERGLAPGEQVVTEGQLRLVPGAKVEIRVDKGPAA